MGCGCKNKVNPQLSQKTIQEIESKKLESSQNIKESIKKTVEKYFNQTKNG